MSLKHRCYCCGCLIADGNHISVRFVTKKQREVKSRGFYHLEQINGEIKEFYNAPYTTNCMAQTAMGSFLYCKDCGEEIYNLLKLKRKEK